jgi:hypothetical protein
MWKSMVETDRPQMTAYYSAQTVWLACQITKACTQTHACNV